MGEFRSAFKTLTHKSVGMPRRKWEKHFKGNFKLVSLRVIGLIWLKVIIIGEPLRMRH